jgi:phosphotriesterase-related protein
MRRREFLLSAASVAAAAPALAGSVLVHEHVLVDFGGVASPHTWDEAEVARAARPKLEALKAQGCARMLECTPNFLGRAPRLLRRLQDEVGIELWTNTGIYGAANRSGVPEFARRETAGGLAARWIEEARRGVDGMKPRFIKTGVNGFPLEDLDRKLVEAAALTSLETGLTIASHTNGAGPAAMAQLEILARLGCPAERFVWVHAQSEKEHGWHEKVARAGAWVELDGIGEKSAAWHLECVEHLREKGLLGRVLISQDAGWYHAGEPGGGEYRGYTYLYTGFAPGLRAGVAKTLLVDNPRRAFGG